MVEEVVELSAQMAAALQASSRAHQHSETQLRLRAVVAEQVLTAAVMAAEEAIPLVRIQAQARRQAERKRQAESVQREQVRSSKALVAEWVVAVVDIMVAAPQPVVVAGQVVEAAAVITARRSSILSR
jgi:hypothetical protein